MALEEGDITQIADMITKALAANKGGDKGGDNKGDGGELDPEAIKAAEAKRKASEARLKSAMTFNIGRDAFLEKHKSLLPESVATVIKAMSGRNFKDEEDEANQYRKIIFDEVFGEQANIDLMPETSKAKIATYKALADSDKAGRITDFYELVEMCLALKQGKAQKEFNENDGNQQSDYTKRFEQLGQSK